MKWSINSESDNNGREISGHFNILGQTYTYEENKLAFTLGGLGLVTIFSAVLAMTMHVLSNLLTAYDGAITSIVGVILAGLMLMSLIGGVKYAVTGDARPFVKVKSEENGAKITFFEW